MIVSAIFDDADRVLPLFSSKVFTWARPENEAGKPIALTVRDNRRAAEKFYRCYGGDARYLYDLVRASIDFTNLRSLCACLDGIANDSDVRILYSDIKKSRFRKNFSIEETMGY